MMFILKIFYKMYKRELYLEMVLLLLKMLNKKMKEYSVSLTIIIIAAAYMACINNCVRWGIIWTLSM